VQREAMYSICIALYTGLALPCGIIFSVAATPCCNPYKELITALEKYEECFANDINFLSYKEKNFKRG
jgi:hypothetical protein